jgi:hypothetical protein
VAQLNKTLYEATEAELRKALVNEAKYVNYSYADIEGELERRRIKRQTTRSFFLSLIAVVVSALSLLASVLVALFVRR